MSQIIEKINPVNWNAIVRETIKRRRCEKLTRAKHAALAQVSIPTMIAFERGELSVSLQKAFAILEVVGLIAIEKPMDTQYAFMQQAFNKWENLISKYDQKVPIYFPHGWYIFHYYFEGDLKNIRADNYKNILEEISTPAYTGWRPFLINTNDKNSIFYPRDIEYGLENWIEITSDGRWSQGDYWQSLLDGRSFIIRGFSEDRQEGFNPGLIFDINLPIRNMAETMIHAIRLAKKLRKKTPLKIHFQAHYHGLMGRVLRSWSDPIKYLYIDDNHLSMENDAYLECILNLDDFNFEHSEEELLPVLVQHIHPLASLLYDRFDGFLIPEQFVHHEIQKLLLNKHQFQGNI
ncbi:MAG: hypothetical protein Q8K36_05400 [Alphaproteobacteria bacterium]|nr:hypothetical protein [Alphaproteobacteria bacterium]